MGQFSNAVLAASVMLTSVTDAADAENSLFWTPEAMMKTKMISDVQLSPDHQSVLFVVTEPKMTEEKGVLLSRIYLSSVHKRVVVPFSAEGVSSSQPRWSPNGEWIAFISEREGKRNLYLISANGGEAIPLTKGQKDVQIFSWSPDGKNIAFVMSDETEQEKAKTKTSLAYVYKEKTAINRLWLIDIFSSQPSPKPLTSDDYCVKGSGDFGTNNTEFDWSPDSKEIVFSYIPAIGLENWHLEGSLATLNIATGQVTPWEKKALFEAMPRYSPDGQWVAYLSSDSKERYTFNRQLAIRSADGSQRRLLAKTHNEGPLLAGPNFLGWSHDGKDLLFFEPKGTKFHIVMVSADGTSVRELKSGQVFFKEPSLSHDRSMLAFIAQTPSTPPEAYVASLDSFIPTQVSSLNESLLVYPQTDTRLISWRSQDELEIEGLLTYPIGYEEGKKYPLVVFIHGGPMGFFDETFLGTPNPYPLAPLAQEGFFILRANPRGSTGYGKNFLSANYNDWGGMDFADIMAGVDALIAKGVVDADRMGVMGWSYGGYMTAWTITQTSRFKAASIGAGLSDLVSMNGTTDLYRFLTDYLGESTVNESFYRERSPINHVAKVSTPCLIQHGTADLRVPVSQAYEFYHALERTGKKVSLILYPEMGHRLSDPKMQLDALQRNLQWFQQYLHPG